MRHQGGERVIVESGLVGLANPALELASKRPVARLSDCWPDLLGDEGAESRTTHYQALVLQIAIGPQDRVRVERDLGDDLLHGRKLVARFQHPEQQRLP